MRRITPNHVEHYHEHGYAVVKGFLTARELADVRGELRHILPGWVEFCDDPGQPKPPDWDRSGGPGNVFGHRFPFPGTALNAITQHPELIEFARRAAGGSELFCEQSHLHFKCKGHPADRDQAMHCDYGNHTLAYPPTLPAYWQTAYLLYYTDVTEDHAPTAVCSRRHYPERILWPALYKREQRPQLYDNEERVVVPAGSLFIYSMRTFHRGTPFRADVGRLGHFITYAPAAWRWLGIVGWSAYATKREFGDWIKQATPAQRELLGFPPPGHPYWTEETLDGVSARYQGMDMTPYRSAMVGEGSGQEGEGWSPTAPPRRGGPNGESATPWPKRG